MHHKIEPYAKMNKETFLNVVVLSRPKDEWESLFYNYARTFGIKEWKEAFKYLTNSSEIATVNDLMVVAFVKHGIFKLEWLMELARAEYKIKIPNQTYTDAIASVYTCYISLLRKRLNLRESPIFCPDYDFDYQPEDYEVQDWLIETIKQRLKTSGGLTETDLMIIQYVFDIFDLQFSDLGLDLSSNILMYDNYGQVCEDVNLYAWFQNNMDIDHLHPVGEDYVHPRRGIVERIQNYEKSLNRSTTQGKHDE